MKNLIHTAAVTLFAASAAHAQEAVQWKVSDGGNGHWYAAIHPTPMPANFADQDSVVNAIGAHMATLQSSGENNFAIGLLSGASGESNGAYFGLRRVGNSAAWKWIDDLPLIWNAWGSNNCSSGPYPNNGGLGGEMGAHLYQRECGWVWDDTPPSWFVNQQTLTLIVEWDADCNNDGIVDYGQCYDGTLPDYNGNNVPDCCERGEACVAGRYPVQWRVIDGGNGHWYQVRAKVGDWLACRAESQGLQGDLASPSTAPENSFVERLVPPKQFPIWNRVFLGGRQNIGSAPNEGWYWVDGSAWNYVDWFDNQPDGGEGFLVTMPDESGCTWGDYPANSSDIYYFMVEWSADCNNDGIVDYGQILQGQLVDANTNGIPDICEGPTCNDIDLNLNGIVDGGDLGILLAFWGPVSPAFPRADINKDGFVNGADLGIVLAFWGPCPN
jgi:hypothetical protein